jgi:hypothetical protein
MKRNQKAGIKIIYDLVDNRFKLKVSFLLIFILLITCSVYAQLIEQKTQTVFTKDKFQNITHDKAWLDSIVVNTMPLNMNETENGSEMISFNRKVASKSSFTVRPLLDSILEKKNSGYTSEWIKWRFYYDETNRLLSSKRFFFNAKNVFENITETRSYNEDEQIIKLVRHEISKENLVFYDDTTAIDVYIEEYQYQNGNLIHKSVKNFDWYNPNENSEEDYVYNEQDQLVQKKIRNDFYGNVLGYLYYPDGEIEYVYITSVPSTTEEYSIDKYQYQYTDSIKETTICSSPEIGQLDKSQFDTISTWYGKHYYFETFDTKGRRKSISSKWWSIYQDAFFDIKAEFEYADDDQLLHASYYTWEGTPDSGSWKEATRIDNTYDQDGNLLLYSKTFNDGRTGNWVVEEEKTYYYDFSGKSAGVDNLMIQKLSLFPNPACNLITIENLPRKVSVYRLYNSSGKMVESGKIENNSIIVGHLKPGMYIIKLDDFNTGYSGKFVKY